MEPMSSNVTVSVSGAIRTVTLARPAKRNALTSEMLTALEAAFSAEPGPDERVGVVRAEGSAFCAGVDLSERPPSRNLIERAFHAVEHFPMPVVAIVQGDAIAGGAELAIHCDIVVAVETARIGMSLAQIGLAPPWPLALKLLDVAGPSVAREILLLGDPLPAGHLAQLGVIARAVSPEDLEATAQRLIDRLATNAPLSLRAIKASLLLAAAVRSQIPHDDIDRLIDAAGRSEDAREGMRARLEKRPAAFRGR
jgi:enoyl-CoA hydratase/carnithine racemase